MFDEELDGATVVLAEPGRLLTGMLEPSKNAGQPGKSYYQVRAESVEPTPPTQFVELIEVPVEWASEPRGLVSGPRRLTLDHPPLNVVYALWRGFAYGPLRTTSEPASADSGDWLVKLSPANADNGVIQLPETLFDKIPPDRNHRITVRVSLTNWIDHSPKLDRSRGELIDHLREPLT